MRAHALAGAAVVAGALLPLGLRAQAASGPLAPVEGHQVATWTYPRGDRRDPTLPPRALYTGEGFPELRLHSIAFDPQTPAESRALVVLTGRSGVRATVRPGERVGQFRVVEISRGCITALQNVLGTTRRSVLCLQRPGAATRP